MSNRLDQNQQEKVRQWYHDHPLLCACQDAFQIFQAGMHFLLFSPTEVFVESVEVIDNILEEGSDNLDYIHGLWQKLIIRYKLWPLVHQGNVDDKEYESAVSSVFYSVAIVLSRHSDDYYSELIKDALLAEIESHVSIVKQQEDNVIVSFSQYADKLEQWMDEYASSDSYLSDDIDDIVHGKKPRSSLKIVHREKGINKTKPKKPKPDYTKYSFTLSPKRRVIGRKEKALEWLHDELKDKKYVEDFTEIKLKEDLSPLYNIEERNKLVFNSIFSGEDTDYYILWIGTAKELGYFVNQLEERGVLSWKKGPRKWQVTRNRIWHREEISEISETTGKVNKRYIYVQFDKKSFNGSLIPANTIELDKILDVIAPPVKMEHPNLSNEIEECFRNYADYEKNNKNDEGEKKSKGFRETSHKAK